MKLKDFFTKLKADGKINQAEFVSFVDTVPEFEIPDKAVEAFESSFLTIDRAATDKSVHSKLKREILDPVDQELKPLLQFIDSNDKFKSSEIDRMNSTYDKLKAIQAFIPQLFEKVKKDPATDEDTKKKLKTFEETNQELLQRIEKMNKDYSEKEKFFETESEKKINNFRTNMELEKLANSFKFGKAFSDDTVRKDITKVKLDALRAKHALQLVDKDGQTHIQVTDKDGKPLFNGNSAVTINQLLEEEFKPYIKANNVGDDDIDEPAPQATKRFQVQDGKPNIRQGTRTTVS
jgi:alkylhydroperoxidase/carboxymuconolactone decarboxylase family protein YurZ